jgi:nicotinamide-nucleotide amidase
MPAGPSLQAVLADIAGALRRRGERLATAESCTGGLIAAACTELPGSSDWFERGFVTYSNAAKHELLGVDPQAIANEGAVSESVARAMAKGALARAPVAWSIAVTGIAGPGGAVPGKPVGTVWLAIAGGGTTRAERLQLSGDRAAIRADSVLRALLALRDAIAATPARAATPPR